MKKFFLLFLGLLCSFMMNAMSESLNSDDESQKVELKKDEILDSPEYRPRSMTFLEAYFDSVSKTVEIQHEGLGACDIYLMDEYGNVLEQFTAYSDSFSSDVLSFSDKHGSFLLVIDSDVVYAYGTVYFE